ncbi:MAG: ubiquitin-conjugating enzyme E2 [Candidatus Heimdallarchaeota archaeon]|nr:ubiquitin-conjugating enzyme E2 [Candidatus Heimdallarchaeota archaeon]
MPEKPMLTEDEWLDRLAIEAQELAREQPTFRPVNNDLTHWRGEILGSGLYEGGVFFIEIHIPRKYPFEPPKVRFKTPIWHVNIFKEKVCVGILGKDWSPAYSLIQVVETIRFLLNSPNPDDPLNAAASRQWKRNREAFIDQVSDYITKYAHWNQSY